MSLPSSTDLLSMDFVSDAKPILGNVRVPPDLYTLDFVLDGKPYFINQIASTTGKQKSKFIYNIWGD